MDQIKEGQLNASFSFEERKAYFKRKWRKEHILLFIILGIIWLTSLMLPIIFKKPVWICLCPLIGIIEFAYQNNRMMIYVEHNFYD